MKKTISTTLIILVTLSILPMVLAIGNGKIIVSRNELLTQIQNKYQLSNGEDIEVKITLEQAKEKIRERIRERLRIQNCSCEDIQIVEIENIVNEKRIAYQVNEEQVGKILGLFRKRIQIQTNLDVETGEIINLKRPWYTWMMRFKNN